jgi:hypothetical protein
MIFLAAAGLVVALVSPAAARERFTGRISGGGANCGVVSLDIVVDGGAISGGGALPNWPQATVTVSGSRSGSDVQLLVVHDAPVPDDRMRRLPLVGKFRAADRLEVWQQGQSLVCNPGRRGVLTRR